MSEARRRELEYHEKLYSGFAQSHFARPAVRALRAHMVSRILAATGAGKASRVLSFGCGIGDTELLLAPHVGEVVGIDLSPAAIRQARADATALAIRNAHFEQGAGAEGSFDVAIAIFPTPNWRPCRTGCGNNSLPEACSIRSTPAGGACRAPSGGC